MAKKPAFSYCALRYRWSYLSMTTRNKISELELDCLRKILGRKYPQARGEMIDDFGDDVIDE
jgi:hypothetical protein